MGVGIVAAIRAYLHDFSCRAHVPCVLTTDTSDFRLTDDRAIALFRILQEAVTIKNLSGAIERSLADVTRRQYLQRRFNTIHETLRAGGAARAAQAVLQLLQTRRAGNLMQESTYTGDAR